MKEVTYEEWQKNPTPRMMWVWDYDTECKVVRKVVYVSSREHFPVITVDAVGNIYTFWHCAEIEEHKKRRMTNQELSWWLQDGIKDGKHREFKYVRGTMVYNSRHYIEEYSNDTVNEDILIRENDGEWREPLVGVEE